MFQKKLRGGEGYTFKERGGGGQLKFYPYKKRGRKKVLAILKRGHNKFWGSFNTSA